MYSQDEHRFLEGIIANKDKEILMLAQFMRKAQDTIDELTEENSRLRTLVEALENKGE